jgi:DNA-binding Lrp family transcriptional regulator
MTESRKFPQVSDFLKKKISEIQSKNARISIRSICLRAGISSGRMTDLLNGRRPLSEYYAEKLSFGLKLDRKDREDLYALITISSRKEIPRRALSENELAVVTGWENYAILNLLKTNVSETSQEWIADRLAISVERVAECIEGLLQLGLIKKTNEGLERISTYVTTSWDIPSDALKEAHRQVLHKSIETLATTEPKQRDYSSLTIAIDVAKLESAKELIGEFRKKFSRHLEPGPKSEVYNLSIQFFPLTRLKDT